MLQKKMQKTYVVVGASSGIGLEIATQLLAQNHRVIGLSRTQPTHPGIEYYPYNVTQPNLDDLPQLATIDGLVYAPGTINLKPFRSLKRPQFQADLEVNLLGAIDLIQWALQGLQSATHPAVLFFSTVAVQQGMPFHASIAAAKGAVEGLTRSLAAEWAPKIRVNAIAPSLTDTPLADRLLNSDAKREAAAKRHPLQRVGTPQDLATAALYLLSENASWITGQIIPVDGGMSSLKIN
jgi:NAD(P)-dependent dehydrogenase (short-subunit alcohol dehydrogenase family)